MDKVDLFFFLLSIPIKPINRLIIAFIAATGVMVLGGVTFVVVAEAVIKVINFVLRLIV